MSILSDFHDQKQQWSFKINRNLNKGERFVVVVVEFKL
jgi:hypothetical protein